MNRYPKIVLIEDDEDDYLLLSDSLNNVLTESEFSLQWYSEAPDAAEMLDLHDPDVVMIDYRLGSVNGVDLARQIRELNQVVSIILLTGLSDAGFEEIEKQSTGIAISDFLSKPDLNPQNLARSVRYGFENSRQRRALSEQALQMEDVLKAGKTALYTEDLDESGTVYYSNSIEALTGYRKDELESGSVSWWNLVLPEDLDLAKGTGREGSGYQDRAQYRFRRKDGEIIWIEEVSRERRHPVNREVRQLAGRLQDITRRYNRENSLRLMASSLEQSNDSIIITDSNLTAPGPIIIYANAAASRMTGYAISELIGQSPRIFQGPKTDRALLGFLKAECLAGRPIAAYAVNYRKDGSEYSVSWKIFPIRDEAGRIINYISTQRDVTEEQKQKLELERHQAFLKETGELAKVGGWRYELGAETVFWTDQVYDIHGEKPGEPVTLEKAISFFTPDCRTTLENAFNRCITDGVPYDLILSIQNAQGKRVWTRSKGEPLIEDGKITGAWGVFQDVTELHKLRVESEIFYCLAFELSCTSSTDGYFLELNDKWVEILGYSLKELRSKVILEFVHPDDREASEIAFQMGRKVGFLNNFKNRYLHKDGHVVYFSWNAQVGPDGLTLYSLARDISDIKSNEMLLQEALLKANSANQAKNQFLMVMSHELRTPLNPILGFADLLLEETENPVHREYLAHIKSSGEHLASLIGDILDISSIETGNLKWDKEPLAILPLIRETVEFLRPKAEEKGLKMIFMDSGCGRADSPLVCMGDKRKIRQVIWNIASNAIKFTRNGSVTVEFLPPAIGEGMANLCIRIIDTGIGIDENELEPIFERFYQVSKTSSREFQGQGLGLTLSRQLAEHMEGSISATSRKGEGSVFAFSLRLELVSGGEPSLKPERPEEVQAIVKKMGRLRVLVVEDDPVNRMVIGRMLKRLDAEMVMANDGVEALESVREHEFDLILMDIQMPRMDGIEATRQIRSGDSRSKAIPIIAVSAHAVDGIKKTGMEAGMSDFIEKPISMDKLASSIAKIRIPAA